jgi:hypothetical protein
MTLKEAMFGYLNLRSMLHYVHSTAQEMQRHQLEFLSRRLAHYDTRTRDIAYLVGATYIIGEPALAVIKEQQEFLDVETKQDLEAALNASHNSDELSEDLASAVNEIHQAYS